jgi:hypothetical protein
MQFAETSSLSSIVSLTANTWIRSNNRCLSDKSKTASIEAVFISEGADGLFALAALLGNGSLESSACREFRRNGCWDGDRFARSRITTFASSAFDGLERTETDQLEAFALSDCLHDGIENGVNHATGLSLRNLIFFGDNRNEFLFVHEELLYQ